MASFTPTGNDLTWSTAQNAIWQYWNQATASGTTIQDVTWAQWMISSNVTSASSTSTTWNVWNQTYEVTCEQAEQRRERALQQIAQQRERQHAIDAEREAYRAQREVASARAEELLLSLLTEEQAASYAENGWFEVRGSRGGRWRIRRRGQAGNVDLMPEIGDVRQATFCCHPPDRLPDADAHAAQMLHLVTDEDGFRRTANQVHGHMAAA